VAELPFFLALTIGGADEADPILHDVAASALEQMGYSTDAAAAILRELDAGLETARGQARGQCDVKIRAEGHQLFIVIAVAGGREWRLTRPLPSAD
jgi:hypothetical protein